MKRFVLIFINQSSGPTPGYNFERLKIDGSIKLTRNFSLDCKKWEAFYPPSLKISHLIIVQELATKIGKCFPKANFFQNWLHFSNGKIL